MKTYLLARYPGTGRPAPDGAFARPKSGAGNIGPKSRVEYSTARLPGQPDQVRNRVPWSRAGGGFVC